MKRYVIFSLIFISLSALLIYVQSNSYTTLNIFGIILSLPNAVWVSLFLGIFFILSLLFIFFTNLKNIFYKKNIEKDITTIISNIKNKILFINSFKETKILNDINNFVNNINGLEIIPNKVEKFEFLEDLEKIKNGEVVELSKYKLNEYNPWYIKNIKNKMKKEPSYAKEVLKKFKNEELKKEAFYIFAKNANIKEILKYDYPITFEVLIAHLNDNNLKELIKRAELTPIEEIEFARKIYMSKTPDEELSLLDNLSYAKIYLALKYEHLDLAKEIIEQNSIKFFEYFLKLRECGIKVDIDEFIDSKI